jgi:hypothetical protein
LIGAWTLAPLRLGLIASSSRRTRDANSPLDQAIERPLLEKLEWRLHGPQMEFGETIASIVLEVTDDKSLPKRERNIRQIEHAACDQFKRNGQVG